MPVRITKSDTMLSANQFEQNLWCDTSSWINLEDDDFGMKFLDMESSDLLSELNAFDSANMDFSDILTAPSSPKYQIRHHDCMWSGTCVDKSHPSKKKGINLCPASTSSTVTQQPQTDTCTTVQKPTEMTAKLGPVKTIMTPISVMKSIGCKNQIPAGRSLLINSRINTNTAPTKLNLQIKESRSIDGSCKEFDTMMHASLRPDTPLSLGDEVPEFKHNIDLTPCPSSNRVKFNDANSTKIIAQLVEHLEETSNSLVDTTPIFGHQRTANDLNDILTDITFLSDYEDMGDDSSAVDMDDDEAADEIDYKNNKLNKMLTTSVLPQATSSRTMGQYEFISDHSYTRPKGSRYDPIALGVQTPSDSEEEIDVVNISEKNLPTNPSARDRRALQTTVAHKIARSKQSNGRRRVSNDDSISSSTSTLSSKGSTPMKVGSQTPNRYVFASRKRNMHESHKKYRHGHSKKQRLMHSKHQKMQQQQQQALGDPDEADTIEKRNLHNNMERQRRIGLKNLFEELKCQIPSLKDKERAPKVNILREAAVYCTRLRREEDLHAELMKKHNRLATRLRNLKSSIAAQQRRNY